MRSLILSFYTRYVKRDIATMAQFIVFPKGNRASLISLKCCIPNGIPTIVIQNTTPQARCVNAIGMPPTNHQITFIIPARQPDGKPESSICVPNGQRATIASFKVWSPKGMPMIVIIITRLDTAYSMAIIMPPNTIQIILSRIFIVCAKEFGQRSKDINS